MANEICTKTNPDRLTPNTLSTYRKRESKTQYWRFEVCEVWRGLAQTSLSVETKSIPKVSTRHVTKPQQTSWNLTSYLGPRLGHGDGPLSGLFSDFRSFLTTFGPFFRPARARAVPFGIRTKCLGPVPARVTSRKSENSSQTRPKIFVRIFFQVPNSSYGFVLVPPALWVKNFGPRTFHWSPTPPRFDKMPHKSTFSDPATPVFNALSRTSVRDTSSCLILLCSLFDRVDGVGWRKAPFPTVLNLVGHRFRRHTIAD